VIARLLKAGKLRVLAGTLVLLALTTLGDWATGHNVSLAALYILPMMLGAVVLRPAETAAFALVCSYLRSWFDVPGSFPQIAERFVFAVLAYFVSGLFVTMLVRKHEQAVRHLAHIEKEQALRLGAEEQLRLLADSSPAAILTVDECGVVLAANAAANQLFMIPSGRSIQGGRIGGYLPSLADAVRWNNDAVGLRTSAQCQGHRENGEIFLAQMWFSSYLAPEGKRLAAIVVDSSEELRDREEQNLRHLLTGNRIATSAIAHEVRNFCEAMTMLCNDLGRRHELAADETLRGLDNLVEGLEAIASMELKSPTKETVEDVPLREILDNLRIVIEPAWREIEGSVRFHTPASVPSVWAEPHGLMQVFLNLSQNSHRAVQEGPVRELNIAVSSEGSKTFIEFRDSGPGVPCPERLFRLFQDGAAGSGLGLYVSRFIIRSYGGELRFEPQPQGSCFAIELPTV